MNVTEKRKLYRCGRDYCLLKEVTAWPEFFEANEERLLKLGNERVHVHVTGIMTIYYDMYSMDKHVCLNYRLFLNIQFQMFSSKEAIKQIFEI